MEDNDKKHPLLKILLLDVSEFAGGAVVALIIFAVLFFVLNYFNIISLSSIYKPFSLLPRQTQTNLQTNFTLPNSLPKTTNPLVAKAKTLGYNIIKIDPNDTIGRTVFYKDRVNFNNDGIGIKTSKNINGKQFISQIVGTFESLKEISNSSDKYLLLRNPTTKEQFPLVRILMNSAISPSSEELTYLIVEDLNYNGESASLSAQNLGSFRHFSEKEIKEIFHKGDAVAVGLVTGIQGNAKDENQQLEGLVVFTRRFGGKEEIEKELGKTL